MKIANNGKNPYTKIHFFRPTYSPLEAEVNEMTAIFLEDNY